TGGRIPRFGDHGQSLGLPGRLATWVTSRTVGGRHLHLFDVVDRRVAGIRRGGRCDRDETAPHIAAGDRVWSCRRRCCGARCIRRRRDLLVAFSLRNVWAGRLRLVVASASGGGWRRCQSAPEDPAVTA